MLGLGFCRHEAGGQVLEYLLNRYRRAWIVEDVLIINVSGFIFWLCLHHDFSNTSLQFPFSLGLPSPTPYPILSSFFLIINLLYPQMMRDLVLSILDTVMGDR